ncbi:MAG: hypothetical protein V3S46_07965, partial [Nitrospinota bacterium]
MQFFPNKFGKFGADYSFPIPYLLDGYFWFKENGIFGVPWFTPSFCGGLPRFPDPQSGHYSIPQFINFVFDPVVSVKLTFIVFAALGFWGFYILLRKMFHLSSEASLLGATLFLFNDFYTYRMIGGHFNFHSFMLFPFIVFWIGRQEYLNGKPDKKLFIYDSLSAGFLISYMVYSGAASILPIVIVAAFVAGLIYGVRRKDFRYDYYYLKIVCALLSAAALSSSMVVAVISYLKHFPRDYYPLPGIPEIKSIAFIIMKTLFWAPAHRYASEVVVNSRFALDRGWLEYGITVVPLLIILAGVAALIRKVFSGGGLGMPPKRKLAAIASIVILLSIPVFVNYYSPAVNAFLKTLPLIKNSSDPFRWFLVYIPIAIIAASIFMEITPILKRYDKAIAIVGIVSVVGINYFTCKEYYQHGNYDAEPIVVSYHMVEAGERSTEITHIGLSGPKATGPERNVFVNNMLAYGVSQLNCYDPIFGYNLESFPF